MDDATKRMRLREITDVALGMRESDDPPAVNVPKRPSHDQLLKAIEALGAARDVEQVAGNHEVASSINMLVISLFALVTRVDTEPTTFDGFKIHTKSDE